MRQRRRLKLAGLLTAVAATVAACGGNGTTDPAATTGASAPASVSESAAPTVTGPATTQAAQLRADLTKLLTDHVYLAGIATNTAITTGADSPAYTAAVAEVDENSVALSKAVGAAYPQAEQPFLNSWRQHINFFVDYTVGAATKDTAKKNKAKADLAGYGTSFGQLINGVVPEIPVQAVADNLEMHVATLTTTIDAQAAKDPSWHTKLKTAADHMPSTAKALATGIDANKNLDGAVDSQAADLHAGLSKLLTDHVYLAGLATNAAMVAGPDSPAYRTAVTALDANSVALSKAIGAAYPQAEQPFLTSWRQHINMFVEYAVGAKTNDQAKKDKARADLEGYRASFGQLINSVVPEIPAEAVANNLQEHVATLLAVIDAQAANDPSWHNKLKEAGDHMSTTAKALATGIAANKKMS